ncbi:transposase [Actinoplanes sp. TBRC 11911]|uniref:transposase n=1 Tax=Actinoplanes sp. TBRC 11911 TaxID=2729386 RepID=UPI00145E4458|nr:transposase [Actinoplanes sp. TBRC 11911]
MLRARAVRLYRESDPKPTIRRPAEQLNVHHETLRNWIRQAEADAGERHDRPSTDLLEGNRRLAKENAEQRQANETLRAASARVGHLRRPDLIERRRAPTAELVHLPVYTGGVA